MKSSTILFRTKKKTTVRRTSEVVNIIDWFPTLLDMAGLEIPNKLNLDSVSQKHLIEKWKANSGRDRMIYGIIDKLEDIDGSSKLWHSKLKYYITGGKYQTISFSLYGKTSERRF